MKNNSYRPHFIVPGSSSTRLASSSAAPSSSSIAPTSIGAPAIAAQVINSLFLSDLYFFLLQYSAFIGARYFSDW
ncbi:unnamed protein product [Lathyrus oleraceus]